MTSHLTKTEALRPFAITCARCGGAATAYAFPLPKGSVFCPACSPAWLQPYLEYCVRGVQP